MEKKWQTVNPPSVGPRRGLIMCTYRNGREGVGATEADRSVLFQDPRAFRSQAGCSAEFGQPMSHDSLREHDESRKMLMIRAMRQHGKNSIINKGSRSSLKTTQMLPNFPIFRPRATIDDSSIYLLPHRPNHKKTSVTHTASSESCDMNLVELTHQQLS